MDRDAYLADDEVRDGETPLAVIVGGRVVDEALRGLHFHQPEPEIQFRDPRGRKREDRRPGLLLA